MAHYDSNPGSPGASDNASGVSIVLEIARALAADGRPANDLIVLFTDGEEQGVLGAPLFIEQHAWAKSVRAALNFDGISTGPVFLWQTGPRNGWLIDQYARSPRPRAMSWIDGVARVLPLDTDFRPFLEAGVSGASFTTPYLPAGYHTPLDRPALVNPASIRHGTEQGLALARSLLASDLAAAAAADKVYLSLWGDLLITYPLQVATGLGLLAGALTLLALVSAVRSGEVRLRGVGSAALFTAANMLFVLLLQLTVEIVLFASAPMFSPWIKIPGSLALLLLLLGFGYRRLRKRITPEELLLGGQVIWAVLAVWSSLANPLFSPLLTIILLVSLLPRGIEAFVRRAGRGTPLARAGRILALALIWLAGAPVVYMLYMITGLIWIPAALGAVAFSLLLALAWPGQELAALEG